MSATSSDFFEVAPFDGTNYPVWSRRAKAIFSASQLESFLEREADLSNQDDLVKSRKAFALLISMFSDSVLASFHEDTACKLWKKLSSVYEAKEAVSQILTRKRLATAKKSKDVPMRQHIDGILNLVTDLRLSGAEVSDMDSIVYILMSLPREYESVRVSLEN